MPPRSMKLDDVSDREVLALLADVADGDGTASTLDLATAMDLGTKHPLSNVGVRLAYLRRIKMVDREPTTKRWFLTSMGLQYVAGRLSATQQRALESLKSEGAAWAATESLSRLLKDAGDSQATMMRRQWQHGWAQRNYR
jgi:hypothetical protein